MATTTGAERGGDRPTLVTREQEAWGPAPDAFPSGVQLCVLHGVPTEAGLFTVRLKAFEGCVFAPHSHPHDEHVTVISGALLLGNGSTLDRAGAQLLNPGGYAFLPREQFHYAWAVEEGTVFQVSATGPFGITYANPEDDPRRRTAH